MAEIDVFYGQGVYRDLKAKILEIGKALYVELYNNEILVDVIDVDGKNIHYAESIAENFCNGIPSYSFWDKLDAANRKDDPLKPNDEGGVRT